ncbi:MAG: hypothetical protein U0V48_02340 [Anaerolineales bacterium]
MIWHADQPGVDSTTNGTIYFDDFESRRFSYIGTLADPGVDDPQATNQPGWFTRRGDPSPALPKYDEENFVCGFKI